MNMEKRKALMSPADKSFFNFVHDTVDKFGRMKMKRAEP